MIHEIQTLYFIDILFWYECKINLLLQCAIIILFNYIKKYNIHEFIK